MSAAENPFGPSYIEPLLAKLQRAKESFLRRAKVEEGQSAVWKYVEELEQLAKELVQLIEIQGIGVWKTDTFDAADQLKNALWQEMQQLRSNVAKVGQSKSWQMRFCQFLIDWLVPTLAFGGQKSARLLVNEIERSQKFLGFHFQNFHHQRAQYRHLAEIVDAKLVKMQAYGVLKALNPLVQGSFKQLYRWLNLWEENLHVQGLPKDIFIGVMQRLCPPEEAENLFKTYYEQIEAHLFTLSRKLKLLGGILPKAALACLSTQHQELHTLGATIEKYRQFILCNDPDPYVNARGGFPEWTIGEEPEIAQHLRLQVYDIEALDQLHQQFYRGLEEKAVDQQAICAAIEAILHAMANPLASKDSMSALAKQFVYQLEALGELHTTDQQVVTLVGTYLLKALQLDRPGAALFETREFKSLYAMHMAIAGRDPAGQRRLQQIKWHLAAVLEKANLGGTVKREIDSLKDVIKHFNQTLPKENTHILQHPSQEILEYTYLFGQFFFDLRQLPEGGAPIRNEFLFVDQMLSSK